MKTLPFPSAITRLFARPLLSLNYDGKTILESPNGLGLLFTRAASHCIREVIQLGAMSVDEGQLVRHEGVNFTNLRKIREKNRFDGYHRFFSNQRVSVSFRS